MNRKRYSLRRRTSISYDRLMQVTTEQAIAHEFMVRFYRRK